MRFMERLTLTVVFLTIVGERWSLVSHSLLPLNAAIDTSLLENHWLNSNDANLDLNLQRLHKQGRS